MATLRQNCYMQSKHISSVFIKICNFSWKNINS